MTDLTGRVVAVTIDTLGDELVDDASAGATTLTVDDAADFNEDGGALFIGAQIATYSSVDDETGVLILDAPLAADALAGDPVYVWDLESNGVPVEHVAHVEVEGEELADDTLEATIDHALIPYLAEGIRNEQGEAVVLEWRGDDLFAVSLLGKTPTLDAGVLVGTVPDAVLEETSLQADLLAAEAAIATATANAQDALDAAAQAVLDAAAAQADADSAQSTADGKNKIVFSASPASGTSYATGDVWFQKTGGLIVGQWEFISGAWAARTIDNAVIANVNAGKITAGTLDAGAVTIRTAASGSRVELKSTGLIGYDSGGNVKTTIDATTGKITAVDGEFTGIVKATSGEVQGILDMVGTGVIRTAASGKRVQVGTSGVTLYTTDPIRVLTGSTTGVPTSVAVDASGNIYVTDTTSNLVRKFSAAGVPGITFSTVGLPEGIAIGSTGTVFVGDTTNNRIRTFSASGVAGTSFATTGVTSIRGIALDSSDNVYVVDYLGSGSTTVRKYSPSGTAGLTFTFSGWGVDAAVDASGNIYVTDITNSLVRKFNSSGTAGMTVSVFGWGVDVDASGNIYVGIPATTSTTIINGGRNGIVKKYNSSGTFLADVASIPGRIAALTVSAGDLYLVDEAFNSFSKFNTSGAAVVSARLDTSAGRLSAYEAVIERIAGTVDIPDLVQTATSVATVTGVSPFAATDVVVTRVGTQNSIQGTFNRPSGSSTAFTKCGEVSATYRPAADLVLPAQTIFNTGNTYQFVIRSNGNIEVRMSAAFTFDMALNATWS